MKRKLEVIPRAPGIYKILVLLNGKWIEPPWGAKFCAAKYIGGQRVKRNFDTFVEAKDFRFAKSEGDVLVPKSRMNVGELIELWKEAALPTRFISTQEKYKNYLQHLDSLKHLEVEKLTPQHIDHWINYLKSERYLESCNSTRTNFKNEFGVLRQILNFYASRVNRNYHLPFLKDHTAMLEVKKIPKVSKDITAHEFVRFLTELKGICQGTIYEKVYYLAFFQYSIYGRIQDAAALHYEDFDFGQNKIRVNKKVVWIRKKGFEPFLAEGSKTDAGKEIVLTPFVAQTFKEMVLKFGIRSGPLFLLNGELFDYRRIQYLYSKALKNIGVPFSATHILRHASLTEHYNLGKDILATKKAAGHTKIETTMKYAKVRDETMVNIQTGMDRNLSVLMKNS